MENENLNENLKSGSGLTQNECKGPSSSCAIEKNLEQRVSDPNFPKKIGSDSLSTETILEAVVDKTYKEKAANLVQKLKSNPKLFTWDENGIVSISNRRIPGANILDIVPNILYKKEVKEPQEVFGFIEKNFPGLDPHSETLNHWWYLGPVD